MLDLDVTEVTTVLDKCKRIFKALDSELYSHDINVIDSLLQFVKSNMENKDTIQKNKNSKENEAKTLLMDGQYHCLVEKYKLNLPDDSHCLYNYWQGLNNEEKSKFTLLELKIIYFCLTDIFDDRQRIKKEEMVSKIDDLVLFRRRREELNKSTFIE